MRLSIHILQIVIILFTKYETAAPASCSSAYGAKPCPYVPSPPGERPQCAKYGFTYCEYPEHYPKDLVMHLLEKWKYDHGTLLQNESPTDYGVYTPPVPPVPPPSDSYGPPPNTIGYQYPAPAPVYGPPAVGGGAHDPYANRNPNSYIPPPPIHYNPHNQSYPYSSSGGGDGNYPQQKFQYNSNVQQNVQQQHYKNFQAPEFNRFQQNVWNKWNGRKFYMRKKRSIMKRYLNNEYNSTLLLGDMPQFLDKAERKKRQSNRGGEQLCDSFSQFIMPRAAMNNKGDWMYVVNVPEVDGRYSQLVKSESCVRQGRCSNLCSLPNGYTSRCEQRYVQKRLVAVEPGGGNLYTDVFWFPSCCLCTINRL